MCSSVMCVGKSCSEVIPVIQTQKHVSNLEVAIFMFDVIGRAIANVTASAPRSHVKA